MHRDGEPDHLVEIDRIDTLLRQSLAIADIVAETDSGSLAPSTIPTLCSLLRSNLREIDRLRRRLHTNQRKEQGQ
jgi:hypothetical protein